MKCENMATTEFIDFDKIVTPEVRASSRLTEEQRAFFSATVEEFGVIQDPVVRTLGDGTYELIAGRTRILEMEKGGATGADMKVIEADEDTALFMHLAENVARGSVDPISVAKVIAKLIEMETSIPEIARKLGRSESWVRRTHQLLELPERYQVAVSEGQLTPTHIATALQMPTPYEVDQALQTALKLGWNTSILKVYVGNRLAQLETAKLQSQELGREVEAPAPDPVRLTQYKMCLTCGYQSPAEKIAVLLVCQDCVDLVRYVIAQCGAPDVAITKVYEALLLQHKQPVRTGPPARPGGEPPPVA